MSHLGKVEILLSTFNGERFLRQQLDSIKGQTYKDFSLRVRDDGSRDGTAGILEEYSADCSWVDVSYGKNIGVVASFFELLNGTDPRASFIAFCDQDDLWYSDKIGRAVAKLAEVGGDVPAMYCSALRLVDENLNVIGVPRKPCKSVTLRNALVENMATGCTVVLNRAAIDLLIPTKMDHNKVVMHDAWVNVVISAFGVVVYDERPSMDYRQHGGNVVGSALGVSAWMRRLSRFFRRRRSTLVDQANELLRIYSGSLPVEARELVADFVEGAGSASFFDRLRYVLSTPLYRQRGVDNVIMRALIVLGWR
ncbi:glycosyltransferase family 2 protein [Azoarcus sp. DN11]|uniref:glycosyltransferase family 2 protein n=1 Tax=Azoarcus sp. DN11 TaxID=356837 RepID=UPI0013E33A82|nr:glycosyltransferase family 2 protein [Azoarcus sp. DN11]